jgi:mannose-6-phosphate isomerase
MYPLKFEPIFKEVLWGGEKILSYKGINSSLKNIGESWEISTIPQQVSIVSNGKWKGRSLIELIKEYQGKLTGESIYQEHKENLPLLFKFIDTKDHCSVQVHPNDEIAKKKHSCNGKTEIWYVIDAEPDAVLISGFSKKITPEEFQVRIKENTLEEILFHHEVKAGDVFFVPAGRIHAIGRGLLVAEIQQNSDITYRVYDYGRQSKKGDKRELHTEDAIEALNFSVVEPSELKFETSTSKKDYIELVNSDFFDVNLLSIKHTLQQDFTGLDSFIVYMCIEGTGKIQSKNNEDVFFKQGESILIPASLHNFTIESSSEKPLKLLECFKNELSKKSLIRIWDK